MYIGTYHLAYLPTTCMIFKKNYQYLGNYTALDSNVEDLKCTIDEYNQDNKEKVFFKQFLFSDNYK